MAVLALRRAVAEAVLAAARGGAREGGAQPAPHAHQESSDGPQATAAERRRQAARSRVRRLFVGGCCVGLSVVGVKSVVGVRNGTGHRAAHGFSTA